MNEAISYKGLTIEVLPDEDIDPPWESFDMLGSIFFWHKKYTLGRPHPEIATPNDFKRWANKTQAIYTPLYMMDHSGLTLDTDEIRFRSIDGYGWDWGFVGFLAVSADDARRQMMVQRLTKRVREDVLLALFKEVETLNQYLSGDIWYITVNKDGEMLDSCGGFYGYDYAVEEGKRMADYFAEETAD